MGGAFLFEQPPLLWGCSGSGSLRRCQHGLRSVTCRMTDAQWATLMYSAHLRLYPEGISPHRVVYTMIVSSLIALLLPSFSGALHLIKKNTLWQRGAVKSGELHPFHDVFLLSSNSERLELKVPNINEPCQLPSFGPMGVPRDGSEVPVRSYGTVNTTNT